MDHPSMNYKISGGLFTIRNHNNYYSDFCFPTMRGPSNLPNPLRSRSHALRLGDVFGPLIHRFARVAPYSLSISSTSHFQGLPHDRKVPDQFFTRDITEMNPDEVLRLRVIQGLMNRSGPALYLIGNHHDSFWLGRLSGDHRPLRDSDIPIFPEILFDPDSMLQRYLALTLCGIHGCVPVHDAQDPFLNISSLTEKATLTMMIETSRKTNSSMISFRNTPYPEQVDFIVRDRLFLSPLSLPCHIPIIGRFLPKNTQARTLLSIMDSLDNDSLMIGYNIRAGVFGEYETISFLSDHGCSSLPVPGVPNLSFFSTLPRIHIRSGGGPISNSPVLSENRSSEMQNPVPIVTSNKPEHIQSIPSEGPSKTYIAILLSDGDNLELPFQKYESFGEKHSTPLGWSISPFLNEFAPTMFDYYSSNLAGQDTLVCAPSGAGFTYPSQHANLPAFLQHTRNFMDQSHLEYLWLLDHPFRGYSPMLLNVLSRFVRGMFLEYAIVRSYRQSMELYGTTPAVFSAGFVETDGKIAKKIIQKTPKKGSGFLAIGVEMRYHSPSFIDSEIDSLDPDRYEVVGIPRFFELMRNHLVLKHT
jgi:hypothetical protein